MKNNTKVGNIAKYLLFASLLAANIPLIVGVVFFNWGVLNVVLIYFAETIFVLFYGVMGMKISTPGLSGPGLFAFITRGMLRIGILGIFSLLFLDLCVYIGILATFKIVSYTGETDFFEACLSPVSMGKLFWGYYQSIWLAVLGVFAFHTTRYIESLRTEKMRTQAANDRGIEFLIRFFGGLKFGPVFLAFILYLIPPLRDAETLIWLGALLLAKFGIDLYYFYKQVKPPAAEPKA